jgi:hypothetical protein
MFCEVGTLLESRNQGALARGIVLGWGCWVKACGWSGLGCTGASLELYLVLVLVTRKRVGGIRRVVGAEYTEERVWMVKWAGRRFAVF